jgi:hypothetical protein
MRKFQSPTPNRKGVHEVHVVPERKVPNLIARGWTEVTAGSYATVAEADAYMAAHKPAQSASEGVRNETAGPLTESLQRRSVFDLSGNWMQKRAEVRDTLGLDSVPKNKDEARVLLEGAGYEVTEG